MAHAKFHGDRVLETVGVGLHVFVAYRNPDGQGRARANMTDIGLELEEYRTVAGVLPSIERLQAMLEDDAIDWIGEDSILKAAGETEPYGVAMVTQTVYTASTYVRQGTGGSCSNAGTFKVAIADSGMSVYHPDLICNSPGASNSNCIGRTFGNSLSWYNPVAYHGTHVSGILAARKNNQGVIGMIPDDNLCIITARVLDDKDYGLFSNILAGINWAVSLGARVINLSLVGGSYLPSINQAFEDMYNYKNVLVFAAAGNDGSGNYAYPASYRSVISVGAVDVRKQHPFFSQSNNMVDLSGPGQDVLSTLPTGRGNVIATFTIGSGGQGFSGVFARQSPKVAVSGPLVLCPNAYTCKGPGRHICLMASGGSPQACQLSGGIATVVYNTRPERLTDYSYSSASIPVMMVSDADGATLMSSYLGQYGRVEVSDGYGWMFGTSMATPYVAGAATYIWRQCPLCKNTQVYSCLSRTAMDLGSYGRDNQFGNGMVQTRPALACLQSMCC